MNFEISDRTYLEHTLLFREKLRANFDKFNT